MFPARLRYVYPSLVILEFETKSELGPSSGVFSLSEAVSFEVDPEVSWALDSLIIEFPFDAYVALYELTEGMKVDEWHGVHL